MHAKFSLLNLTKKEEEESNHLKDYSDN